MDYIFGGSFKTPDPATTHTLVLRSDIDWIRVYNRSAAETTTPGDGVEYYWQRGMTNGRGIFWYHPAGDHTVAIDRLAAGAGFYLIDTSSITITRATNAITNITAAGPPVVTSTDHGLMTGDIVRLASCNGALQLCNIDFTVERINANTFSLVNMATPAAAAAAPDGVLYKVSNDSIYLPRNRSITGIDLANNRITMSVTHDFTVGQQVRFVIPRVNSTKFGTTELDNQIATVTNTGEAGVSGSHNTIDVDIDLSGYTTFAFPTTDDVPFTPAQVVPVGVDVGTARTSSANEYRDAVRNGSAIIMKLMPGAQGPGGDVNDEIYWSAGKFFSNLAE